MRAWEAGILPTSAPAVRTFGSMKQLTRLLGCGLRGAGLLDLLPVPVRFEALDALDADQPLATLADPDQAHSLGVTSLDGDLVHRGAHQCAGGADQHDLLARQHL